MSKRPAPKQQGEAPKRQKLAPKNEKARNEAKSENGAKGKGGKGNEKRKGGKKEKALPLRTKKQPKPLDDVVEFGGGVEDIDEDWSFSEDSEEEEEEGEGEQEEEEEEEEGEEEEEEEDVEIEDGFDTGALKIDFIEKHGDEVSKRINKLNKIKEKKKDHTAVYLGRIPHGFYEKQMKSFFSQFGSLRRLKLSRNKKTGHSKHYAFLEFEYKEVAQLVVETMHNYLLFGHLLKCYIIPPEKVHPKMFKGCNTIIRPKKYKLIQAVLRNKGLAPDRVEKRTERLAKLEIKKNDRFKKLGIDYEFHGYTQSNEAEKTKMEQSSP